MPSRMNRFCLDTNILVSACQSTKGASYALIQFAREHHVRFVVSQFVFDELRDVLSRHNKARELQAAEAFIKLPIWEAVSFTAEELVMALFICPDPNDAPILAAAKKAKMHALVSFDRKHLHTKAVQAYIGAPVITAGDALELLRSG